MWKQPLTIIASGLIMYGLLMFGVWHIIKEQQAHLPNSPTSNTVQGG